MNDDVSKYLDDEVDLDGLGGPSRREAEAWDRLLETFRVDTPRGVAPPWLEGRVMAEIATLPERGWTARVLEWLVRPQDVRVPPALAGLVAAAIAAVVLWPAHEPDGAAPSAQAIAAAPVVYVQFDLEAPGAISVAVGGDFDGWDGSHALDDSDGDGVWTGRVAVRPGVHAYMFLVDESTWVTDPKAERYSDDGFGNRNAVLAVTGPST
jgi:hypothetical protein